MSCSKKNWTEEINIEMKEQNLLFIQTISPFLTGSNPTAYPS